MIIYKSMKEAPTPSKEAAVSVIMGEIPEGTLFRYGNGLSVYFKLNNGYVDLRIGQYFGNISPQMVCQHYEPLPNAFLVTGEDDEL